MRRLDKNTRKIPVRHNVKGRSVDKKFRAELLFTQGTFAHSVKDVLL